MFCSIRVRGELVDAIIEPNNLGKLVAHFYSPRLPPLRVAAAVDDSGAYTVPALNGAVEWRAEAPIQWTGLEVGQDVYVLDPETDLVCRARVEGVGEQLVSVRYTDGYFALHPSGHRETIPVGPRVYLADTLLPESFQPIGEAALQQWATPRAVYERLLKNPTDDLLLASKHYDLALLGVTPDPVTEAAGKYATADLREFHDDATESHYLGAYLAANEHILRAEMALAGGQKGPSPRLSRAHFGLARLSQCIMHPGEWRRVRPDYARPTTVVRLPPHQEATTAGVKTFGNFTWGFIRLTHEVRAWLIPSVEAVKRAGSLHASFMASAGALGVTADKANMAEVAKSWKEFLARAAAHHAERERDVARIEADAAATYGLVSPSGRDDASEDEDATTGQSYASEDEEDPTDSEDEEATVFPMEAEEPLGWRATQPPKRTPGWAALRNPDNDPFFDPDADDAYVPKLLPGEASDGHYNGAHLYDGYVDMTDGRGALPRGHKSYYRSYRVGDEEMTVYSKGDFEELDREFKLHRISEGTSRYQPKGRMEIQTSRAPRARARG